MISVCEILAFTAMPAMAEVNSVMKPVLADELAPRTLMAEPVASMAPLSPLFLSSPNTMVSLPIWSMAPSPRSSPRATLILSAASTKPSMSRRAVMPSRPAAPASALSSSRGVRVVMRLKVSFISSTSRLVCPVYFITSVIASSILANDWTYWSAHWTMRSLMARALVMAKPMAFIFPRNESHPLVFIKESSVSLAIDLSSFIRSLTASSSALYSLKSSLLGLRLLRTAVRSLARCPSC